MPLFREAPAAILIAGDVEFFVEEAAGRAAEKLGGEDSEVLRFDDDAPAEAVSDALLNRSLFSAKRIVRFDISRLLGTQSPGDLLDEVMEAWEKGTPGGRREAFRRVRAVLSSLDLTPGAPAEELASEVARKTRRKPLEETLVVILRDLPEEKGGGTAVLKDTIRLLLERGNDGTVALLTATDPPPGTELVEEIARKGLLLTVSVGENPAPALTRLARAFAKEREVLLDGDAVTRLLFQTDSDPRLFAAELSKLLDWAGPGGRVRAADVRANVEDESSEDVYDFFDAVGRRDAGDALGRLERLFSGRAVYAGEREVDTEEYWPVRFFGMLSDEVRRMLLVRARLEETGAAPDASMNFNAFKARVLPRLEEATSPFGRSEFQNRQGQVSPFLWFKAASRAARYSTPELARALARSADVDVRLKSSVEPLDALSVYVAELIAGT